MAVTEEETILAEVEISCAQVGSRRVTGEALRTLLDDLRSKHDLSLGRLEVKRFGKRDILKYPSDEVHNAIDSYDVACVKGSGLSESESYQPMEERLWLHVELPHASSHVPLFKISGPRGKVQQVRHTILDHIDRWPITWHRYFQSDYLWTPLTIIATASFVLSMDLIRKAPSLRVGLWLAFSLYLGILSIIGSLSGLWARLAPFIWFYRPGGVIESRRKVLLWISIWPLATIVIALIVNLIWLAATG